MNAWLSKEKLFFSLEKKRVQGVVRETNNRSMISIVFLTFLSHGPKTQRLLRVWGEEKCCKTCIIFAHAFVVKCVYKNVKFPTLNYSINNTSASPMGTTRESRGAGGRGNRFERKGRREHDAWGNEVATGGSKGKERGYDRVAQNWHFGIIVREAVVAAWQLNFSRCFQRVVAREREG